LQHEHRSRSLSAQDFLPVDFDLPHQTPQCALDVLYLPRSQHRPQVRDDLAYRRWQYQEPRFLASSMPQISSGTLRPYRR